jgi:hypothetical protein
VTQNQALIGLGEIDLGQFRLENVGEFLASLERFGLEHIPNFIRTFSKNFQKPNDRFSTSIY